LIFYSVGFSIQVENPGVSNNLSSTAVVMILSPIISAQLSKLLLEVAIMEKISYLTGFLV